ncbi:MAG: DUF2851 family protein [Tannerellaceae bacterium]|jgi:hypothetical protein|nr:DUF2851 family protein [Tannerellaceae bacterium]
MESLLHYVWKHRLYLPDELITADNLRVEVMAAGLSNADSGPDFLNAKLRIGDTIWVGNVEIHDRASDWFRHHHDADRAYDSVILHVVATCDAVVYRPDGKAVPQAVMRVPEQLRSNIDWLLNHDSAIPCLPRLRDIPAVALTSWKSTLLCERLERKISGVLDTLGKHGNDWNVTFYILLSRAFGFGLNNDAFESLARRLPWIYILKHRSNLFQLEALLFGQAGMLGAEEEGANGYFYQLRNEYAFLKQKLGLTPLDASSFRMMRIRPANSPHRKLAQLAAIWYEHDLLFSRIMKESSLTDLAEIFRIEPSVYWQSHYHFRDGSSRALGATMGESGLNTIVINAVVPLLFAYGRSNRQEEYCERALQFLETLPAENNRIVETFRSAGLCANNAGDSQALIQLRNEYCQTRRCLRCRIGFSLLKAGSGRRASGQGSQSGG